MTGSYDIERSKLMSDDPNIDRAQVLAHGLMLGMVRAVEHDDSELFNLVFREFQDMRQADFDANGSSTLLGWLVRMLAANAAGSFMDVEQAHGRSRAQAERALEAWDQGTGPEPDPVCDECGESHETDDNTESLHVDTVTVLASIDDGFDVFMREVRGWIAENGEPVTTKNIIDTLDAYLWIGVDRTRNQGLMADDDCPHEQAYYYALMFCATAMQHILQAESVML